MRTTTRRQFLTASAASLLAGASGVLSTKRVAAADPEPRRRPNLLYGLTTGTWHQETPPGEALPLLKILDETASGGFDGIRLTGYPAILDRNHLTEEQLADELAGRGLLFSTSSFGGEFRDRSRQADILRSARRTLAMHQRHGCTAATFFPSSAVRPGEDEAEAYRETFRFLAEMGKMAVEEYGVRMGVHNLPGSLVMTQEQVDRYLDNTDPRYVFCAWDLGHLYLDGCDVTSTVRRSIDRLVLLDLKDGVRNPSADDFVAPNGQHWAGDSERGRFLNSEWEAGRGEIDFAVVYEVLKAGGYRGWVIHDLHAVRASAAVSAHIGMSYINNRLDPIYQ
jgi:sugar phosphate isomerase/epimerase